MPLFVRRGKIRQVWARTVSPVRCPLRQGDDEISSRWRGRNVDLNSSLAGTEPKRTSQGAGVNLTSRLIQPRPLQLQTLPVRGISRQSSPLG